MSELARREIPLLVEALRAVLALHAPDTHGRCPICRPRATRNPFRSRGRTPCRAYLAVQLRLGTVENPARTRHRRTNRRHAAHPPSVG